MFSILVITGEPPPFAWKTKDYMLLETENIKNFNFHIKCLIFPIVGGMAVTVLMLARGDILPKYHTKMEMNVTISAGQ
jgi:hypothetical protein